MLPLFLACAGTGSVLLDTATLPAPSDDADDFDGDGYSVAEGDCDDEDANVFPGTAEICDGVDNNCDGEIDEPDAFGTSTWLTDSDGDGFGDPYSTTTACEAPSGTVAAGGEADCDDSSATIHPDADEVCDELDNDCDGSTDEGVTTAYHPDEDGDGAGDPDGVVYACAPIEGMLTDGTDCDDDNATVYSGAPEHCDGLRNDCADSAWSSDAGTASFVDADGDWSLLSGDLAAGTSESPAAITLRDPGTLYLCESDWFATFTVESSVMLLGVYGAESTALIGSGSAPLITATTDQTTVEVVGLTLTGGAGGVVCSGAVVLDISSSTLIDNSATRGGGLYGADGCVATLTSTTFTDNTPDDAWFGGSYTWGGTVSLICDDSGCQ